MKMDQVKKMFESKPEGRRRIGRPRLRCLEDVERNLREMKVERCTVEWTSVIKTLREL